MFTSCSDKSRRSASCSISPVVVYFNIPSYFRTDCVKLQCNKLDTGRLACSTALALKHGENPIIFLCSCKHFVSVGDSLYFKPFEKYQISVGFPTVKYYSFVLRQAEVIINISKSIMLLNISGYTSIFHLC